MNSVNRACCFERFMQLKPAKTEANTNGTVNGKIGRVAPVTAGTVKVIVGPYKPLGTAVIAEGLAAQVAPDGVALQLTVMVTELFVLLYRLVKTCPDPPREGMVTVVVCRRMARGPSTSTEKDLD